LATICSKTVTTLILLIALMFLSGCNIFGIDEIDQKYIFQELKIDSVELPDSVQLGQPVRLCVSGNLPDAAWNFDRFEITQEGHLFSIRVYGKKNKEIDVVIMIVAQYKATTEVYIDEAGIYYFDFPGFSQNEEEEKLGWDAPGNRCMVLVY